MQSLTPRGAEYVSRQDIERSLDEPEFSPMASSNLDRLLKDMEEQGLIAKKKVRDNDQKTGNPERTYYRLNSLVFSPDYRGDDLKKQFIELHSESENFSIYVKEMLSFINEKGLMDEWTSLQASRLETKFLERSGKHSEKLDKAMLDMLKSSLQQFKLYKRKFSKKNTEEIIILLTSGRYSEFVARVESKCGKGKRGEK